MKAWTDPVHSTFCVRFFLDTNVLVYLVDETFQGLTDLIELLNNSPFSELTSSKYVIFEFVGVRKREHYLRLAAETVRTSGGQVNFSSLIRYKDSYSIPNVDFEKVIPDIQKEVDEELKKIISYYGIDYEYSSLHKDQLQPTFDTCLSSKLDNQDCLVLISSVLPQPDCTNEDIILLTNDAKFLSDFDSAKSNIDKILSSHSISLPRLVPLNNIKLAEGGALNLTAPIDKAELEEKLTPLLLETIKKKVSSLNPSLYLGTTFKPTSARFPPNGICFKLVEDYQLPENVYVTILSKELDFIYNSKKKITAFSHNGTAVTGGYELPPGRKNNISFLLEEDDEEGNPKAIDADIIDALRAEGNLVFLHPDSEVP